MCVIGGALHQQEWPGGTRTCNPRRRGPMPYPLGHGAACSISTWAQPGRALPSRFALRRLAKARHWVPSLGALGELAARKAAYMGTRGVCLICIAFVFSARLQTQRLRDLSRDRGIQKIQNADPYTARPVGHAAHCAVLRARKPLSGAASGCSAHAPPSPLLAPPSPPRDRALHRSSAAFKGWTTPSATNAHRSQRAPARCGRACK